MICDKSMISISKNVSDFVLKHLTKICAMNDVLLCNRPENMLNAVFWGYLNGFRKSSSRSLEIQTKNHCIDLPKIPGPYNSKFASFPDKVSLMMNTAHKWKKKQNKSVEDWSLYCIMGCLVFSCM